MAYFAELNNSNVVVRVIAIANSCCQDVNGHEVESIGISYCQKLFGGTWKQTSFNTFMGQHSLGKTPLRKNYAKVGHVYDEELDAFIPEKAFPSWVLNNETAQWEPPVPFPNDDNNYDWDEETISWV